MPFQLIIRWRRPRPNYDPALENFRKEVAALGTSEENIERAEKKGYPLGIYARHPFVKGRRVPVFAANFVLMGYGEGAIFGCPAHDQRDWDFATKYELPIMPVVTPKGTEPFWVTSPMSKKMATRPSSSNSDFLDGMTVAAAKDEVAKRMESAGIGPTPRKFPSA